MTDPATNPRLNFRELKILSETYRATPLRDLPTTYAMIQGLKLSATEELRREGFDATWPNPVDRMIASVTGTTRTTPTFTLLANAISKAAAANRFTRTTPTATAPNPTPNPEFFGVGNLVRVTANGDYLDMGIAEIDHNQLARIVAINPEETWPYEIEMRNTGNEYSARHTDLELA
jgi:hypothetical protein